MLDGNLLRRVVRAALDEDLGQAGDITSAAVIDQATRARGVIVAREAVIVAGLDVAREVFRAVDPALTFETACADGDRRAPGATLATVGGAARSILAGERTALNFLQRMCGIATAVRRLVDSVEGKGVQIADTRKTAPGLRALDKYAVRQGGGSNHRSGLHDAILIKDNHWRLAGGVAEAVRRARRAGGGMPIEIEVTTAAEAEEAIAAGAAALLLDNMDQTTLEKTVTLARGHAFLEVSGGVREADLPRLAALGIDRISLGAITHSVRAVDLALELERA
jgi:nicotinate-nucleotide pyrophosphorylase (carboxylating)